MRGREPTLGSYALLVMFFQPKPLNSKKLLER
jgi:hypothetical protein